jgi:methylase of polypeptide subunit release factors
MQVGARLPLGVATLAAAAIDHLDATEAMLDSVGRAVKPGGRIVAPVSVPRPDALKELARDDREWVAEVTTRPSGLIELRRRAPDAVG